MYKTNNHTLALAILPWVMQYDRSLYNLYVVLAMTSYLEMMERRMSPVRHQDGAVLWEELVLL